MMTLIVTLAAAGILLVVLELFLPGGFLGLIGAALFLGVIILCYQEFGPQGGTFALVGISVAGILLFMVWLRIFPSSPAGKLLTLKGNVSGHSVPKPSGVAPGTAGVSVTALRPGGTIRVGDSRHEARLDSGFADPGTRVIVLRAEGPTLVVQRAEALEEES